MVISPRKIVGSYIGSKLAEISEKMTPMIQMIRISLLEHEINRREKEIERNVREKWVESKRQESVGILR